jgi:hypothetical protein
MGDLSDEMMHGDDSVPQANPLAALLAQAEADRDHYKALVEEATLKRVRELKAKLGYWEHWAELYDLSPDEPCENHNQRRSRVNAFIEAAEAKVAEAHRNGQAVGERRGYETACRRVAARGMVDFADELRNRPLEATKSVVMEPDPPEVSVAFVEDGRHLEWRRTEDGGAVLIGGSSETHLSRKDVRIVSHLARHPNGQAVDECKVNGCQEDWSECQAEGCKAEDRSEPPPWAEVIEGDSVDGFDLVERNAGSFVRRDTDRRRLVAWSWDMHDAVLASAKGSKLATSTSDVDPRLLAAVFKDGEAAATRRIVAHLKKPHSHPDAGAEIERGCHIASAKGSKGA